MNYIYDQKDWPRMTCDHERLVSQLAGVRHRQARLCAMSSTVSQNSQAAETMVVFQIVNPSPPKKYTSAH